MENAPLKDDSETAIKPCASSIGARVTAEIPYSENRTKPSARVKLGRLIRYCVKPFMKKNKSEKSIAKPIENTSPNRRHSSRSAYRMNVPELERHLRKSGASPFEAKLNAYYIFFTRKAAKKADRKRREKYRGIAEHPVEWSRNPNIIYKKNTWDIGLHVLEFIAAIGDAVIGIRKFFRQTPKLLGRFARFMNKKYPLKPFVARHIGTVLCAGVIAATAVIIVNVSGYEVQIETYVDGQSLGLVSDKEVFNTALKKMEGDISSVLEVAYKFNHNIEYRLVLAQEPDFLSEEEVYAALSSYNQESITQAYGLYVDGNLVGAALEQDGITEVLEEILEDKNVMDDESQKVEFNNDIEITRSVFPRRVLMSPAQMKDILEYAYSDGVLHSSEASLPAQASSNAMGEVTESNVIPRHSGKPEIAPFDGLDSSNTYYIPEEKLADAAATEVEFKYKTIKTEIYDERIQYETIYKDSANYYEGTQVTEQYGKIGRDRITAEVTYVDSQEIARTIVSTEQINPCAVQIILRGTKKIPTPDPTGTYIKPVDGEYGDGYGTRVLRGQKDYHRAQDFPAKKGTPVYATDGGTITFAGWHYSYGNYVVIKHKNGIESSYAHMDKLLVKEGDKVYQGQQIGKVGATGDSMGYHLHFEILKDGNAVDPLPYIEGKMN